MSKYHLILDQLKLYPSLSLDSVEMIEQVMNAVILVSSQNLQDSINRIITLEATCQPILDQEYDAIIIAIQPLSANFGVPIVAANIANNYILHHYNNRLKHFKREYIEGKLDDINHQFSSLKKISYDGNKVEFLPTFSEWVYDMVHQQHTFITENPDDKLMTEHLFPELTEHIQGALDAIESHTNSYADLVRNDLKRLRESAS